MTPEEELQRERHIAEILEIRKTPKKDSNLETWLNSNVLTALITVLGTALLGAWVTGLVQDRSKNNELERTAEEKRLESRNSLISKILERTGTFMSATDDLLVTVNNSYREDGRTPGEIETLRKWKTDMRAARDDADSLWRREQASLGFSVHYLFDQNSEVRTAWDSLVQAESSFEKCTNNWYTQNAAKGTTAGVDEICNAAREALTKATEAFASAAGESQGVPQ